MKDGGVFQIRVSFVVCRLQEFLKAFQTHVTGFAFVRVMHAMPVKPDRKLGEAVWFDYLMRACDRCECREVAQSFAQVVVGVRGNLIVALTHGANIEYQRAATIGSLCRGVPLKSSGQP